MARPEERNISRRKGCAEGREGSAGGRLEWPGVMLNINKIFLKKYSNFLFFQMNRCLQPLWRMGENFCDLKKKNLMIINGRFFREQGAIEMIYPPGGCP